MAAGNLRRESRLAGQTETRNGLMVDTRPTGLLVRSSNAGTRRDDTFAWVPEIDLSLGWRYFPRFDVTVGYHIMAMTEAVQVSGLIDKQLASNLAAPPTDPSRPSAEMDSKTFYVQGIHFGLQYVY
ncbi:MAG: BBP7 family outer membrane beta-barrel protein [Novipirellula sp. JB048]